MAKKGIPENIKVQVEEIVNRFNQEVIKNPNAFYITRYRGVYLYLSRQGISIAFQVCRLKYNGAINDWDFAIYKHSSDRYDPDEWFFPGSGFVNGTVEGALKAGLEAYP